MKNTTFLRLLSSIPIILIFLYFIPFLGICLILLRYLYNNKKKRISTSIYLIVLGVFILIPTVLNSILDIMKVPNNTIPYLNNIINLELYHVDFIRYGKLLLTVGIVFLIIKFIFNRLFHKFENSIFSYLQCQQQMEKEIFQKNDLLMQEKRKRALNTHIVHCSYCGAENILSDKVGVCKYCRRKIE